MAVAITSKAVTKPILEIVQSGKLRGPTLVIGEGMATKHGVYQLVDIVGLEVNDPGEIAVGFRWQRLGDLP